MSTAPYKATVTHTYGRVGFYADSMALLLARVEPEMDKPTFLQVEAGRNPEAAK